MTALYIAGPMTGYPEENRPAFHQVAAALRAAGFDVVNPAEFDTKETALGWAECLRRDLKKLVDCDGIVRLPGWESSRGACLEVEVGRKLGLTTYLSYFHHNCWNFLSLDTGDEISCPCDHGDL